MIEAKKNFLFEKIFSFYNSHIIKKHFNSIRIKGENNLRDLGKNLPTIIYANHSNWWDGLIAFYLSYKRWKKDAYIIMEEKQLNIYRFFIKLGAFSIDKSSLRKSYDAILYSINLLQNSEKTLWIFPQGEMLPYQTRPIKFYNGISKIVSEIKDVNIIPVTFSYEYIKEQRPEILINIGHRIKYDNTDIKEFTEFLKERMLDLLEDVNLCILKSNFEEFTIVFKGKKSSSEIIDKIKK